MGRSFPAVFFFGDEAWVYLLISVACGIRSGAAVVDTALSADAGAVARLVERENDECFRQR